VDAASRQLLSDVPIGLMASGGVDSGLLWWAAREGIDRAYTIRWAGHDDPEKLGDDLHAVTTLQGRFGTPTDYVPGEAANDIVPPSGDLFADPAYGLTRLIARRARDDGHTVLLSGQGGDELFGGYRRHATARLLTVRTGAVGEALDRQLKRLQSRRVGIEYLARLARASAERDPFCAYMHLCSYSTARDRAEVLGCTEDEVSNDVVWQRHREVYENLPAEISFLRRVMAVDLAVYLPGLGLAYADRGGMESGVEIRVPWLDLELVRWSLTLPDDALVRWGRGKWIPKELARGALGEHLSRRPKRGFAAPASRVRQEQDHGARAFRQGAYFARARRTLQTYLDEDLLAST
jgi:asparagine synthase (glutamine-hydrolysing)